MITAGRSFEPHREHLVPHRFDPRTEVDRVDAFVSRFKVAHETARRFERFCELSQPVRAQGRGAIIWNSIHSDPPVVIRAL